LTKPFDKEELLIRIQSLLTIRSILKTRFSNSLDTTNQLNIEQARSDLGVKDADFLGKLNSTLEEKYGEETYYVAQLSDDLHMTTKQLQRKMKALVNCSPNEYIRSFRLNKAKNRLENGEQITVVALTCGFSSPSYFSRCFKAKFGIAPTNHRTNA
jgi:AraC-like DNA-binding protein